MATNPKLVITGDSSDAISAVKRLGKELGALEGVASKVFKFAVAGASIASIVEMTKASSTRAMR